jgi:hypothetical protein
VREAGGFGSLDGLAARGFIFTPPLGHFLGKKSSSSMLPSIGSPLNKTTIKAFDLLID